MPQNITTLAQEIQELEDRLAEKVRAMNELLASLARLTKPENDASETSLVRPRLPITTPTVADRVRRALGTGVELTFRQLLDRVAKGGGSKYALKSALNKGRERGEFHFDSERGVYSLRKKGDKNEKVAPVPTPVPVQVMTGVPAISRKKKNPAGPSTSGVA
jgi:hypothetical protein